MVRGASRKEALERLDDIISFSELGTFIDKPIKAYSTGMRARLAFAIAIGMHTDLLLIDEVLGVGDEKFRRKAETTLVDKISSEQTVVLVSHSLAQVSRLCDRVAWLDKGSLQMIGKPEEVIERYIARNS